MSGEDGWRAEAMPRVGLCDRILDGGGGQKAGVLGHLRPRVGRGWAFLPRASFQVEVDILGYRVFDVEI